MSSSGSGPASRDGATASLRSRALLLAGQIHSPRHPLAARTLALAPPVVAKPGVVSA